MRRVLALVLLVTAAIPAACARTTAPPAGEARARIENGDRLLAARPGDAFELVGDGDRLTSGTVVRAVRGEPELVLAESTVALAPETEATVGRTVEVAHGDVLVMAERRTVVATPVAEVSGRGIVRVAQSLGAFVRVYEGEARVSSLGRSVTVSGRRETSVPERGLVAKRAEPTRWDAGDRWDLRHLGLAIDLDDALRAQARGFGQQAADASVADIAALLALPSVSADRALATRAPAEALIGGAIATVGAAPLPAVFALRDAGAAWGLVAVEQAGDDPGRAVTLLRAAIAAWIDRPPPASSGIEIAGPAIAGAGPAGPDEGGAAAPAARRTAPDGAAGAPSGGGTPSGPPPTTTTSTTLPVLRPSPLEPPPPTTTTTLPVSVVEETVGGIVDLLG